MSERILLLGSGGREHALARTLKNSASCEHLWSATGNPGICSVAECVAIATSSPEAVTEWCRQNRPSLVVIGPELPLATGVSDALRRAGFNVFGPSQAAAQLETSKGFAKDFMLRHSIPTAAYGRFSTRESALAFLEKQTVPVVIKYDGLAAGKGVVVATTMREATQAVHEMFDGAFGTDGVVIEEFLTGIEASIFAITDGTSYVTLAPSHDHKRIGDGDTGKNTGGMGAVAPSPRVTADVLTRVREQVIEPTLTGMRVEGNPFVGCLYCGIMIDASGNPSVVEFNVRFGDPETQVVMAVLEADVAALFASVARGTLDPFSIKRTSVGAAACVVLASAGYPDAYETNKEITGIREAEGVPGVSVFQAGTKLVSDLQREFVATAGGRVVGVTAHRAQLAEAVDAAYEACSLISFDGCYYRTDIGRTS